MNLLKQNNVRKSLRRITVFFSFQVGAVRKDSMKAYQYGSKPTKFLNTYKKLTCRCKVEMNVEKFTIGRKLLNLFSVVEYIKREPRLLVLEIQVPPWRVILVLRKRLWWRE